jgi:alpha-aminoadipic semialdehyde synthase
MKKKLVVGILKEAQHKKEKRSPLTPPDVGWLVKKGIKVEVESSKIRVFKDAQYKKVKAKVVDKFHEADLLVGVKKPDPANIYPKKIYMVFSHTIKGQPAGMPLLKKFLKERSTLIDYEKITDSGGKRLVHFGRHAGICGIIDSLWSLGKKLEWKGIENPFSAIGPAYTYSSLDKITKVMRHTYDRINRRGLDKRISPFIIGIVGRGRVSQGVQEMLRLLEPIEIRPKDMARLVCGQRYKDNRVYKVVFRPREQLRTKDGTRFDFKEYLKDPRNSTSNMDIYLPLMNLLIHTSYWDSRYPRIVTKRMIGKLRSQKNFRLEFIGDISCDINGSIELTHKTTTQDNPVFTYKPTAQKFIDGYKEDGITVLAIDNLPTELPEDSSHHFSSLLKGHIYRIASQGAENIPHDILLPPEIRPAVITKSGRLTSRFSYLERYLV